MFQSGLSSQPGGIYSSVELSLLSLPDWGVGVVVKIELESESSLRLSIIGFEIFGCG